MNDPNAVVSPGGVGFDINCGVRLIRTNLDEKDVAPWKEQLAQVSVLSCRARLMLSLAKWPVTLMVFKYFFF